MHQDGRRGSLASRRDDKPILVAGSPGGGRIITTVLKALMNVIDHGMNVAEATEAPRVHRQRLPDERRVERGLSVDTTRLLQARGHRIEVRQAMGSTPSIARTGQGFEGAADLRQAGTLAAGVRQGGATLPAAGRALPGNARNATFATSSISSGAWTRRSWRRVRTRRVSARPPASEPSRARPSGGA